MYDRGYVRIRSKGRTALVLRESMNRLSTIKKIVFDCDGVLVDSRSSYDLTILETLKYIFKPVNSRARIGRNQIEKLRFTGLYNNEWDTVYALSIFTFSMLSRDSSADVNRWLEGKVATGNIEESKEDNLEFEFNNFLSSLKNDPTKDAERYARTLSSQRGISQELDKFLRLLNWPGYPSQSLLVKLFDSRYYGRSLYKKIYGLEPPLDVDRGLIENEKPLASEDSLARLIGCTKSPLLMLTGRSKIGAEHVLGSLANYFDMDSSVFIEDLMRHDMGKAKGMKKPSPSGLIELARGSVTLYVGDSAEDIQMTKLAKDKSVDIYFAAVTGFKEDPSLAEKYFTSERADILVKTVDDLSDVYLGLSSRELK
ncbi:MAG: hypothetical protein ACUVQ8_04040 [Nitrososphaeria archaeon]